MNLRLWRKEKPMIQVEEDKELEIGEFKVVDSTEEFKFKKRTILPFKDLPKDWELVEENFENDENDGSEY